MVVVVQCPISIHVENFGAIFLSENTVSSQHTNHVDVRHHFICDYVEDGTIQIQFVRSEENLADPFTNNISNGQFEFLTSRYVHHE